MLHADILVEADCWQTIPEAETLIARALAAASAGAKFTDEAEVAVMLADDEAIRGLNRQWRGFDKPTNVLSFPAMMSATGIHPRPLGDIIIAYETCRREAEHEGKPFGHHLSHLAVHGFLHLIGYDHENNADADRMEYLERQVLATLGIPDPYDDANGVA